MDTGRKVWDAIDAEDSFESVIELASQLDPGGVLECTYWSRAKAKLGQGVDDNHPQGKNV